MNRRKHVSRSFVNQTVLVEETSNTYSNLERELPGNRHVGKERPALVLLVFNLGLPYYRKI
jgi:hypothetical protein